MKFKVGDKVVFQVHKNSNHPGPRAKNVRPEVHGENYNYDVDKYWKVYSVEKDQLVLITRTGKLHAVKTSNKSLRKANIFELIFLGKRYDFPHELTK